MLSTKAPNLVNNTNTHCVLFFSSAKLFCDVTAIECRLSFLTTVVITSLCSSLILLLLCSSWLLNWLVSLWCSSCRVFRRFSRSACVFSRVLTLLLRVVFCFFELREVTMQVQIPRDYIIITSYICQDSSSLI